MGIVNVTPDSFSDGGDFLDHDRAVRHGLELAQAGAMMLDVGGESTRPGAAEVPLEEELERVIPVVEALAARSGMVVSIDTRKPEVARRAIGAGAGVVNDVGGLGDPQMIEVCADCGVPVIVMHMQGDPGTMQENPHYRDVVAEVKEFLVGQRNQALTAGVPDVILDPGLGFGKTLEHNLELMRATGEFAREGKVLVGASRKGMIGAMVGAVPARSRDPGSIAAHLFAAAQGAALLRVHDVAGHWQALRVWGRLNKGYGLA